MDKRIFICFSTFGGEHIAKHVYNFCKKRLEYEHVFFAAKEIRAGENWKEKRDNALEECDFFVFIATSGVTTSGEVEYEIEKANKLKKNIIPCKHASIDDWSEIEKKYYWDSMQYVPFDDKDELIPELHRLFAVIPQQQSLRQKVAKEQTGLRLRVKSYQCEFHFKPPNIDDPEPELTREKFIEKVKDWVDNLKAKANVDGKSDDKSFAYLLAFPEGEVTISFDKGQEGNYHTIHDSYGLSIRLIITTGKLEMIDRIIKEVDRPYWVYRINLKDKLDIRYLESQIKEKAGQKVFAKGIRTGQNISMGRHVEYPFGRLKDDAIIKAQLSSGENADSVIQIWFISGGDDVGFYQAHTLLSPDKILSILLGDIAPSKVQWIIQDACSKPSSLESNLTDQ